MTRNILIFFILMTFFVPIIAQSNGSSSDDLVSFSPKIQFRDALDVFKQLYRDKKDKVLVDLSDFQGPISVEIRRLHWEVAFNSILENNDLILERRDDVDLIKVSPEFIEEEKVKEEEKEEVITDEVLIEITFFQADQSALDEVGIDWSTLVDGEVQVDIDANNANQVTEDIFSIVHNQTIESGSNTIDINTIFKIFESNGNGHVIARPQVTVKSGEEGFVQDGKDFSIKSTDEAGNTVNQFFSSGIIVTVTPEVKIDENGNKVIHAEIQAEKSDAQPDPVSTIVTKSQVETKKILFNGEETVIGGLTSKNESEVRRGIPFFKDLPWWVLGIKYLTGYNSYQVNRKELIILLKATVLEEVQNRNENRRDYELQIDNMRRNLPRTEKKILNK